MKYSVWALGFDPQEIEATGPINAYFKYKDLIGSLAREDFKYVVAFMEVDDEDENSMYQHIYYFDNKMIIDHGFMASDKFKRVEGK